MYLFELLLINLNFPLFLLSLPLQRDKQLILLCHVLILLQKFRILIPLIGLLSVKISLQLIIPVHRLADHFLHTFLLLFSLRQLLTLPLQRRFFHLQFGLRNLPFLLLLPQILLEQLQVLHLGMVLLFINLQVLSG